MPRHSSTWSDGLEKEKGFWINWKKSNYQRFANVRSIDPLMQDLIPSWDEDTEILDVASGPISLLGRCYRGTIFKMIQADALEDWFTTQFPDSERPNEAHQVKGEDLKEYFGDRKFDVVVSTNGVDHTEDPKKVLENMAAVCKSAIYLEHLRNCAVVNGWKGLHQWNFDIQDGRVVIWEDSMHRVDVADSLGITNWECGIKRPNKNWQIWFKGWR